MKIRQKNIFYLFSAVSVLAISFIGTIYYCKTADCSRASGQMNQEVYLWQRDWTPSVTSTLLQHSENFSGIAVLAAEISWKKNSPVIFRTNPDYHAMRCAGKPVVITLRIGKAPNLFSEMHDDTKKIISLSQSLISDFNHNGIRISEIQIDYDCAESKLGDYRFLVKKIRDANPDVPLAITALPCWLDNNSFKHLIDLCDIYVLQVQSLERPAIDNPAFMLCDPEKAIRAVEKAGRLGRRFRIALPTYGYLTFFDKNGKFLGLSAEGSPLNWPERITTCEVRSDPEAISELVIKWTECRPSMMNGIVWFRMPVDGDRLNWSWKTLSAVMAGRNPSPHLSVVNRNPGCELAEIELSNNGDNDFCGPVSVGIRWDKSRVISSDALRDFEMKSSESGSISFKSLSNELRIVPGAKKSVGWARFDKKTEVELDLSSGAN